MRTRGLARVVAGAVLTLTSVLGGTAMGSTDPITYQEQSLTVAGVAQTARIPQGYVLEVLTENLRRPRFITFAGNGDMFLGSRADTVYRLTPPYSKPEVLVRLDRYPHSVAFLDGEIVIACTNGVYFAPYRPGQPRLQAKDVKLLAALPGGGSHSSRTVRLGPDGRIYVSLGISGNCSDQYLDYSYPFQDRRGGVLVLDESYKPGDNAQFVPFASGLRNPVGFDWHPQTGVMYASNNGPDHLGFEQPPEYFAKLTPGSFHGMPWFQYDGKQIKRDPCLRRPSPRPSAEVSPPVATFPARNAPMAVAFVPEGALEKTLEGDAVVALHGSWGTQPAGGGYGDPASRRHPKVVVVRFENGEARRVDDLITGFQLPDGRRWARPVGVAIGPDGALYFTSDGAGEGLFRLRRSP